MTSRYRLDSDRDLSHLWAGEKITPFVPCCKPNAVVIDVSRLVLVSQSYGDNVILYGQYVHDGD
jgi:hypothetical protein